MALTNCPQCGHTISDKAKQCPNCGYSFAIQNKYDITQSNNPTSKNKRQIWIIVSLILIALIAAGFCVWIYLQNNQQQPVEEKPVIIEPVAEEVEDPVTAEVKITPEFIDSIHQYDAVFPFYEGMAAVRSKKDDLIGYINTKGELVIPCRFPVAGAFSEGLAFVLIKDMVCFIDRTGKIYNTQCREETRGYFGSGSGTDRERGYMGNGLIYFKDGVCEGLESKITYKQLTGTNPPEIKETNDTDDSEYKIFSDISVDCMGERVKYLGLLKNGKILVPASFNDITPFSNGVANAVMEIVYLGSCNAENEALWIYGFIDKNGNTTFTDADYAKIEKFKKHILRKKAAEEKKRQAEEMASDYDEKY